MKLVDINIFYREVTCTYRGATYRVRDNGAVLRHRRDHARLRPLDEKWTFGRANKKHGYMYIASIPVHRIVATAFHSPQPSKDHVVYHIDTNRQNNRPENLLWVTRLDNILLNPITARRVEIAYGSINNFMANPDRPISGKLHPSIEWMRSTTKEEAEESHRRLLDWAKCEHIPSGGPLGEWVYTSRNKQYVEGPEPDDLIESKTPGATRKNWKTPSEFPQCPSEIGANALDDLEELASDGPIRAASVTDCTRAKCEKCSSPLSRQYLHVVPSSCWKCNGEMKIALIDQENELVGPREFSREQVRIATERGALLKENYSRTMEERYLSNTCPNCNAMTGDFSLHHHYDPEQREIGVPVGAICWSCRQQEIRAKRSTAGSEISVQIGDEWVDVDLRPNREVEFRYLHGAVYIFENSEAQRVKVGYTINNPAGRLEDVNDMWLGRKVTCQICGGRLVNIGGYVPQHVVSGKGCPGGNALPIEKDVALAKSHLNNMKNYLSELSGSEKGSATRIINNLEKRIGLYRHYERPVGVWHFSTAFYTERADQVESLSHEILSEHLDQLAPFGEVFCCSVSEAAEAVETAMSQLGLLHSARKETQL